MGSDAIAGGADNARYGTAAVSLGDTEAICDKRLGHAMHTWTAPDGAVWKRYQARYMSMLLSTEPNFLTVRYFDGRAAGVFSFDMLDDTNGGQSDPPVKPR